MGFKNPGFLQDYIIFEKSKLGRHFCLNSLKQDSSSFEAGLKGYSWKSIKKSSTPHAQTSTSFPHPSSVKNSGAKKGKHPTI